MPDNLGTKSHPPPREGTQQLALQHGGGHQHPPLSPLCRATLTHWFPSASQAVALLQEQQGFSASPNTTMATTGMSAGEEAVVVSRDDSSLSSSGTKGCSTPTRCPQSSRSQLHFPTSAGILAMPGWQRLSQCSSSSSGTTHNEHSKHTVKLPPTHLQELQHAPRKQRGDTLAHSPAQKQARYFSISDKLPFSILAGSDQSRLQALLSLQAQVTVSLCRELKSFLHPLGKALCIALLLLQK